MFEYDSGLAKLVQSRKFMLALLDAIGSTLAIVGAMIFAPAQLQRMIELAMIWQPVIVIVIVSYAVEDVVVKYYAAKNVKAKR